MSARALMLALASFAVTLAVTLPRVCRSVVLIGDSASLVAASRVWGIAHPPGYPLYTLIGHLLTLGSPGSAAYRLNAASAVLHAICAALVALIVLGLTESMTAGFGAACALALASSFLRGSLYAEVFPLNDALVAALFLLAFWVERAAKSARFKRLLAFFFVLGVALGHHHMVMLALPAWLVLIGPSIRERARSSPRQLIWFVVALAVPWLCSVILIVVRSRYDPLISHGEVHDFRSLASLLTRADYGGLLSASRHPTKEPRSEHVGLLAIFVASGFGPVGIVAALCGAFELSRSDRRTAIALLLAFVISGPAFAAMNRVSVSWEANRAFFERFVTMSFIPLAVLIGVGIAWAEALLVEKLPKAKRAATAIALIPVAFELPALFAIDMRNERVGAALVEDLLRDVPDDSLVLISGDLYTNAAEYLCAVEGRCEKIVIFAPGQMFLSWKLEQLRRRHPELLLPDGAISIARIHEIVRNELPRRPVFVVPSLLGRDPVLAHSFVFVPERLLMRVFADQKAAHERREQFVALARDLLDGRNCSGCNLDPRTISRPSQNVEIIEAYATAFRSASTSAFAFDAAPEAERLLLRAQFFDHAAQHPWTSDVKK